MTSKQTETCGIEIEKLRDFIRMQGLSIQTEQAYCRQVCRFLTYICGREWESKATSEAKAEAFLTSEAKRGVSASTQNGAFHAVCYYYKHIRKAELVNIDALRSKIGERIRQAPPRSEIRAVLMAVKDSGPYPTRLIVHLIYGCGLRLGETLAIRLKDLDLDAAKLVIIGGKGKKDRFINLPPSLIAALRVQHAQAEAVWKKAGLTGVPVKLPHLYGEKDHHAGYQKRWFFLFPMAQPCSDPRSGKRVWWHCMEDAVQRAMRTANKAAGTEGITPHHLRHAWATHAHQDGACLRDLQEILGHRDPKTTARYIRPDPERVPSPLENLDIAI